MCISYSCLGICCFSEFKCCKENYIKTTAKTISKNLRIMMYNTTPQLNRTILKLTNTVENDIKTNLFFSSTSTSKVTPLRSIFTTTFTIFTKNLIATTTHVTNSISSSHLLYSTISMSKTNFMTTSQYAAMTNIIAQNSNLSNIGSNGSVTIISTTFLTTFSMANTTLFPKISTTTISNPISVLKVDFITTTLHANIAKIYPTFTTTMSTYFTNPSLTISSLIIKVSVSSTTEEGATSVTTTTSSFLDTKLNKIQDAPNSSLNNTCSFYLNAVNKTIKIIISYRVVQFQFLFFYFLRLFL